MGWLGWIGASWRAWARAALASQIPRVSRSPGRRRAAMLWTLLLVGALSAVWGLGAHLIVGVPWQRAPLLGLAASILSGVALGAPTGEADWNRALLGCMGLVTLWECALLAVGRCCAAFQPYAAVLLQITLTMQAAGLLLAFGLAALAGLFDASAGFCVGLSAALAASLGIPLAWQASLGLLVGLAVAPATGGLRERLRRVAWAAAAVAALFLMNWPMLGGAPGVLILGAEIGIAARAHSRWLAGAVLAGLAWAALMALGLPDLAAYALSGAAALTVLGRVRDNKR